MSTQKELAGKLATIAKLFTLYTQIKAAKIEQSKQMAAPITAATPTKTNAAPPPPQLKELIQRGIALGILAPNTSLNAADWATIQGQKNNPVKLESLTQAAKLNTAVSLLRADAYQYYTTVVGDEKNCAAMLCNRCDAVREKIDSYIKATYPTAPSTKLLGYLIGVQADYEALPSVLKSKNIEIEEQYKEAAKLLRMLDDKTASDLKSKSLSDSSNIRSIRANKIYLDEWTALQRDATRMEANELNQFLPSYYAMGNLWNETRSDTEERKLPQCDAATTALIEQLTQDVQILENYERASYTYNNSNLGDIATWQQKAQTFCAAIPANIVQTTAGTRCANRANDLVALKTTLQSKDWVRTTVEATIYNELTAYETAEKDARPCLTNYNNNTLTPSTDRPLLNALLTATTNFETALTSQSTNISAIKDDCDIKYYYKHIVTEKRLDYYKRIDKAMTSLEDVQKRLVTSASGDMVLPPQTLSQLGMPADAIEKDISDPTAYPLFKKGKKDATDAAANDIQQGGLGDCYFLATAASMVDDANLFSPTNGCVQAILTSDGTKVARFEVKLHLPFGAVKDGSATLKQVTVQVEPKLVENADGSLKNSQLGDKDEVWGAVLEMALVQVKGSFANAEGGDPTSVYSMLTGKSAELFDLDKVDKAVDLNLLRTKLSVANVEAVFNTRPVETLDDHGKRITKQATPTEGDLVKMNSTLSLYGNHAYTFSSIAGDIITLLNPHKGNDEKKTQKVNINDVTKYFSSVSIYNK